MARLRLEKEADFLSGVTDEKGRYGEEQSGEKGRQLCQMDRRPKKGHSAVLPRVWTFLLPVGHLPLHSPRFKPLNRDWEDWVSCYEEEAKKKPLRTPEVELSITFRISLEADMAAGTLALPDVSYLTFLIYESEEGPLGGLPTECMKEKTLEHLPVIMA